MKFVGFLSAAPSIFLLAAINTFARGQSIIDPTVIQNADSINLTPGAQIYIYGEVTGGAYPSSPLTNGTGPMVTDTDGNLSAALAVTDLSNNNFPTSAEYYTISGVGVSTFTDMQSYSSQYVESGTGDVGPGTYLPPLSVDFTLSQPALVVAMGLGSSQQSLSFQGPEGLITDDSTSGAPLAVGIAHAYLDPGDYSITENTEVTADGQTLDNMTDLLGVYAFTVPEPTSVGLLFAAGIGIMARRRRRG